MKTVWDVQPPGLHTKYQKKRQRKSIVTLMAATVPGDAQHPEITIALALAVHAASKCVNASVTGGWRYALALAPGMVVHTGVAVGWLVWAR